MCGVWQADVPEEVPLAGMDHDEHEGMDEASLKEHEEVRCEIRGEEWEASQVRGGGGGEGREWN